MFASNYERMSASDGAAAGAGRGVTHVVVQLLRQRRVRLRLQVGREHARGRVGAHGHLRRAQSGIGIRRAAKVRDGGVRRSAGRSERRGDGVRDGAVVRESRRTCGTASRTGNARSNAIFGRRAAVPSASSALDLVVAPRKKPNPAAAGRSQNPGGFALSRRQGRPRGCAQRPPRRWTSRNGAPTRL